MMARSQAWMRNMWKEAQRRKNEFINEVQCIESRVKRKQGRSDVHFIWLDELLIGIEFNDKGAKKILYANDLEKP